MSNTIETTEFDLMDELGAEETTTKTAVKEAPVNTVDLAVLPPMKMLEPQKDVMTYAMLKTDEQRAMATEHSNSVVFTERNSIRFYGYKEEKEMSEFLDELLEGIKAKDADLAGELLIALNRNVDELKLEKFQGILNGEIKGWFGMALDKAKELTKMIAFLADKQRDISSQFKKMEGDAEKERNRLVEDMATYGALLKRTKKQIRSVMPIIAGGVLALERGREEFTALKLRAETEPDPMLPAEVQDMANNLEAFHHRLTNLQISFVKRAATTIPKIRAIQDAINIEIDNLVDKVIFTIPALKEAIIDVVTLARLQKLQMNKKDEDEMLMRIETMRNIAMKEAVLESKRSQGDYATKIALLVNMKDTIVTICNEGNKIVEDNRKKREEAVSTLVSARDEIETALKNVNQ